MIDLQKYWHLNNEQVTVVCADDEMITGKWINWTSEQDNEPDPESITVQCTDGTSVEIYVHEIKTISLRMM